MLSHQPYPRRRLESRPKIVPLKESGGPILIHDATLYRAREDHGPNGDHYTKPQLESIFIEAATTQQHGIPILDEHLYGTGPIGRLHKWWFDNNNWLHFSGEVFPENVIGEARYRHIRDRIKSGMLKDVSLSTVHPPLPNGKRDPSGLKGLNEISLCHTGKHKNCNIRLIEASTDSQSNKTFTHEGRIMSLTITHGSGGNSLDMSKLQPTLDDLVQVALSKGVTFTQEELDEFSKRYESGNPADAMAVASAIMLKGLEMKNSVEEHLNASKAELQAKEAEMKRLYGIESEVNAAYSRQRTEQIKMAHEHLDARHKAGLMTEDELKVGKEHYTKLGTDRQYAFDFDQIITSIQEAKKLAAEKAELEKTNKQLNTRVGAFEREKNQSRPTTRDSSPKRTSAAAANNTNTTPAATNASSRQAASAHAVAPADAKSAPTDMPANPGALAQSLAPKMSSNGQYVLAEASADGDERPWIDAAAPFAVQGSYARSLPSQTLSMVYEIMTEPGYKNKALTTYVPPPGKQNLARRQDEFHWGTSFAI